MAKNTKVVNFHTAMQFRIGIVIGLILLLYLGFHIFSYLTSKNTSVYEVEAGTIVQNNHYKALAIRQESVVTADHDGYPVYFARNGAIAGMRTQVYAMDDTGSVSKKLAKSDADISNVSKDDIEEIENSIHNFVKTYSRADFNKTYAFQSDLSEMLEQSFRAGATAELSGNIDEAIAQNKFHYYITEKPGYLLYSLDGGEGITLDTFTSSSFDAASTKAKDLRTTDKLSTGDPVYKLITDDHWQMVMEIPQELVKRITDEEITYLEVKFDEDKSTSWGEVSLMEKEGLHFLVLNLDDSVERFADERFISVELMLDEKSGLKIPNSSIVENEFNKVPIAYFYKGNNSSDLGVMKKGDASDEFVSLSIYKKDDNYYYIDPLELPAGSRLQMPDSAQTYTVGEEHTNLKGVYNVNRGYAIFQPIDILYSNENYTIIADKTAFGVDLYDHIALDGANITDNEVIF